MAPRLLLTKRANATDCGCFSGPNLGLSLHSTLLPGGTRSRQIAAFTLFRTCQSILAPQPAAQDTNLYKNHRTTLPTWATLTSVSICATASAPNTL